jgi:hypothetical protein
MDRIRQPYRIHTVLTDNGIQFADLFPGTAKAPLPVSAGTRSIGYAALIASNTGSPNPIIPRPMDRSNG